MYLQISKTTQQKAKYGEDILISRIGLYEDNGKRVKWIKLDDNTGKMLTTLHIPLGSDDLFI